MEKLKFFKICAIALLLLNISLIGFFLITKPKHPNHGNGNRFQHTTIKMLSLNETQKESFKASAKSHHIKITEINKEQQDILRSYFNTLTTQQSSSKKDSLLTKIKDLEQKKIVDTYDHFEEIKTMLTDKQLPFFDEYVSQALNKILPNNKKRHHRPKGF